MSEPTLQHHDPLNLRKNGCLWVLVIVGTIGSIIMLPLGFQIFFEKGHKKLHVGTILKDIRVAIISYETEYGHYPIPETERHGPDVTLRTRGLMVPVLLGREEGRALNPKEIKFIDFPAAKNHKEGLWQDGAEWVLSDRWGEPYYVILDTDKDDQVPNPEYGVRYSDPKRAEFYQKFPLPKLLPLPVAIYSSGPDRDPKTWDDNLCSWRSK